jgi:hypothetical protein
MRRRAIACTALMALHAASQSITIDWTMDGATGASTPQLRGMVDDEHFTSDEEVDAEAYEEAWWRGGFGDDTQSEWFAASRTPRGARPASMVELGHRVGTVFHHTQSGALGVIVGWDARTRAPREWLGPNLPGQRSWAERMRRLYAPHYSVLEQLGSGPDMRFQQRYIVAHCTEAGDKGPPCLQVITPPVAHALQHPDLPRYFSLHDPAVGYVPNKELALLYPEG